MEVAILIIFVFIVLYFLILFRVHELGLENLDISKYLGKKKGNILFVFPHPDDETMVSGGLISMLAKDKNLKLKVVSLTAGEKGTEFMNLGEKQLGNIRKKEFSSAMNKLGVQGEVWGFFDSKVKKQEKELSNKVRRYIKKEEIDLVVTYEKYGLYGHPDHMVLSRVVNELNKKDKNFKVLYSTLPKCLLKRVNLPYHMAEEEKVMQTLPNLKVPIWGQIIKKYSAAYKYKSQNLGQGKPLWLLAMFGTYEYYSSKFEE